MLFGGNSPKISIIVPTYKNSNYLVECIKSLDSENINSEILIGIDRCQDTLKVLSTDEIFQSEKVQIYYFNERVGPYVIRNTLAKKANADKLLFFDSDDILIKGSIDKILKSFHENKIVKFKFYNFFDGNDYTDLTTLTLSPIHAHGVFCIDKELFFDFNGFFGWRCGADTEFLERYTANGFKSHFIETPLFYRRYHDGNLTRNAETGVKSEIRKKYEKIILERRKKKSWSNPEKIETVYADRVFDWNIEKFIDSI